MLARFTTLTLLDEVLRRLDDDEAPRIMSWTVAALLRRAEDFDAAMARHPASRQRRAVNGTVAP